MSNSDDNYIGILLEQIHDEVKAVHEAVGSVEQRLSRVEQKVDDLPTRDESRTVTAAVTDQNKQLQDHERRITHLETAETA